MFGSENHHPSFRPSAVFTQQQRYQQGSAHLPQQQPQPQLPPPQLSQPQQKLSQPQQQQSTAAFPDYHALFEEYIHGLRQKFDQSLINANTLKSQQLEPLLAEIDDLRSELEQLSSETDGIEMLLTKARQFKSSIPTHNPRQQQQQHSNIDTFFNIRSTGATNNTDNNIKTHSLNCNTHEDSPTMFPLMCDDNNNNCINNPPLITVDDTNSNVLRSTIEGTCQQPQLPTSSSTQEPTKNDLPTNNPVDDSKPKSSDGKQKSDPLNDSVDDTVTKDSKVKKGKK